MEVLELPVPAAGVAARSASLLRACDLRFRPSLAGGGARDATVGRQTIRLRPAGHDDPPTVRLRAPEAVAPDMSEALGLRWVVRR
jgi:hypothetical protein